MKQLLDSLKKNAPYDGLFFDIQAAMSVAGLDDPESDMIIRIRKILGNKTIISTSMDLHGNVSWRLAENRWGEVVRGRLTTAVGAGEANRLMGGLPAEAPAILGRTGDYRQSDAPRVLGSSLRESGQLQIERGH